MASLRLNRPRNMTPAAEKQYRRDIAARLPKEIDTADLFYIGLELTERTSIQRVLGGLLMVCATKAASAPDEFTAAGWQSNAKKLAEAALTLWSPSREEG